MRRPTCGFGRREEMGGVQLGARSAPASGGLGWFRFGFGVFFVASLIGWRSLTPWRGGEAEAVERRMTEAARWGSLPVQVARGRENELRGRGVRTTRPQGAEVHSSN